MDDVTRNGLAKLDELEEKVRRAIEELKVLRAQRDAAQAEARALRTALAEHSQALERLQAQLAEIETERDEVRRRIEELVARIDSLTGAEP